MFGASHNFAVDEISIDFYGSRPALYSSVSPNRINSLVYEMMRMGKLACNMTKAHKLALLDAISLTLYILCYSFLFIIIRLFLIGN